MNFVKYQHIERFGTAEVEGIEIGRCYIFPKIDGTNASVWLSEDKLICAGSRNRELTADKDNAGFYNKIIHDTRIQTFLADNPGIRLYGEWLVPHSLKTYRDNAWRNFYIFDVCYEDGDSISYIPYDEYAPVLKSYGLDYIPPIKIIENPTLDKLLPCLEQNNFLIKDGQGAGEGIVIKNYGYRNKYGRQTWAKIVTSEFKEKHVKEMGAPVQHNNLVEEDIVNKFVTKAFVEKEYAKIVNENDGWSSRMIPQLLGRVYHELICEEMWNILKDFKSPVVNFKALNTLTIARIKAIKPELF